GSAVRHQLLRGQRPGLARVQSGMFRNSSSAADKRESRRDGGSESAARKAARDVLTGFFANCSSPARAFSWSVLASRGSSDSEASTLEPCQQESSPILNDPAAPSPAAMKIGTS